MKKLRFIRRQDSYADFSTSISPALELALERGEEGNAVVLDIFKEGSFTAGFLDDPEKSLDLEYCKRKNIIVRRRQNTGGAIYGPKGSAFIVIYVDTRLPWVPIRTIKDAFEVSLSAMADVMRDLFGVDTAYRPLNDIEAGGKKLVASSARLEKHILTVRILVNVSPIDQDMLRMAIITPPEKIQDKEIKDPGERFTCLEEEIGRQVTQIDLETISKRTVETIFGKDVRLVTDELSMLERKYADEYQKRYTSQQWFYANCERMRFTNIPSDARKGEGRRKAVAGLIRVTILVVKNVIHDLIITGDFHPTPYHVLWDMEDALRGKPCDISVVKDVMEQMFNRQDVEIAGVKIEDFLGAFTRAFAQAGV